MHDSSTMEQSENVGDLVKKLQLLVQAAPVLGLMPPLRQALARQELHHQIGSPICEKAEGMDLDGTRMDNAGERHRLLEEPLLDFGITGVLGVYHLDRDPVRECYVNALLHSAHSPGAELTDDSIVVELRRRQFHSFYPSFRAAHAPACNQWRALDNGSQWLEIADSFRALRKRCVGVSKRRVDGVYFGGATANLTPKSELRAIGEALASRADLRQAEVTLEVSGGLTIFCGSENRVRARSE